MKDILQREHPVLREISRSVPVKDIGAPEIRQTIADLTDAMNAQKDGIAIAAPQIGVPLRLFVVSGALLAQADKTYKGPKEPLVFINPEITKTSKEKHEVEEGCLSVRWLYGKVKRSAKVSIRAYDADGKRIARGASGLLAQVFQHEVDHLNGILFVDKAYDLEEMSEEEILEMQKVG